MTTTEIRNTITTWSNWASDPHIQRYDIALLKIWIQFERFIREERQFHSLDGLQQQIKADVDSSLHLG